MAQSKRLLLLSLYLIGFLISFSQASRLRALTNRSKMEESSRMFHDWTLANRKVNTGRHFGKSMMPGFVTGGQSIADFIQGHHGDTEYITLIDMRTSASYEKQHIANSRNVPYTEELHERIRNGYVPGELVPDLKSHYVVFYDAKNDFAPEFAMDYARLVHTIASGKAGGGTSVRAEITAKELDGAKKAWGHVKTVILNGGYAMTRSNVEWGYIRGLVYVEEIAVKHASAGDGDSEETIVE